MSDRTSIFAAWKARGSLYATPEPGQKIVAHSLLHLTPRHLITTGQSCSLLTTTNL
jgi:hypothetical protein